MAKVIFLFAWLGSASQLFAIESLSNSQKFEVKEKLQKSAESATRGFFSSIAYPDPIVPEISILLEFDEARLKRDSEAFEAKERSRIDTEKKTLQEQSLNLFRGFIKEQEERLQSKLEAQAKEAAAAAQGVPVASAQDPASFLPEKVNEFRFGMLNIDISRAAMEASLKAQPEKPESDAKPAPTLAPILPEGPALSLSFSGPGLPSSNPEKFNFDPMDYASKIIMTIGIPASVPQTIDQGLIDHVHQAIDFKGFKNISQDSAVKLERRAAVAIDAKPAALDVIDLALKAALPTGLILAALCIGGLLFVSAKQLAGSLSVIASNMLSLKPKEDEVKTVDATWSEKTDGAGAEGGDESSNAANEAASANALTSEMQTIREQLRLVILESPQFYAERFLDILSKSGGHARFRDLLGFVGYQVLRPAMDLLPQTLLIELKIFIEDTRHEATSLLNGVEFAQNLYRDSITDIAQHDEKMFEALRQCLVGIDDRALAELSKGLTGDEAASILKILSMERGSLFMKHLSKEMIKAACEQVDRDIPDQAKVIASIIAKADALKSAASGAGYEKRRRLILKVCKEAELDEEENALSLIAEDDWTLRAEVMAARFPYLLLEHVPVKYLKSVFDSFDNAFKAKFICVQGETLKALFLGLYEDGSKLKELILSEINETIANEARRNAVLESRKVLIGQYLERFRDLAARDRKLVDFTIINICRKGNLQPPEHLQEAFATIARNESKAA